MWIVVECCFSGPDIFDCLCEGICNCCSRCSENKLRRQRKKLDAEKRQRLEAEQLEEERKARNSFIYDVTQPPAPSYSQSPYNPNAPIISGEEAAKPTAPPLTQSQMTYF